VSTTAQPDPSAPATAPVNEELWSFLRILLVLAALIGLTVFLALHYSAEKDAAAMLGVVVPVLTAILGLGLGYASGTTAGKAKGQAEKAKAVSDGRHALAAHLLDLTEPGASPDGSGENATLGHVRAALRAVKAE
jgi:hypothetical protein